MNILIARETTDQPEVLEFFQRTDEWLSRLYPAARREGAGLQTLVAPHIRFFVARIAGRAVGCGGYAIGPHHTAELKRIFVDEACRGRGIGLAMISTIEASARREGVETMLLETGVKSDGARRLYDRLGYRERGPFGDYPADELSVFMEKKLGG